MNTTKPNFNLNDLADELGIQTVTTTELLTERAALEEKILAVHGVRAEEIGSALRDGRLQCGAPHVDDWVQLDALLGLGHGR